MSVTKLCGKRRYQMIWFDTNDYVEMHGKKINKALTIKLQFWLKTYFGFCSLQKLFFMYFKSGLKYWNRLSENPEVSQDFDSITTTSKHYFFRVLSLTMTPVLLLPKCWRHCRIIKISYIFAITTFGFFFSHLTQRHTITQSKISRSISNGLIPWINCQTLTISFSTSVIKSHHILCLSFLCMCVPS